MLKKCKVYSSYQDNIWSADLVDLELITRYNNGVRYLLCVININSRYAWVVPLKNKKGITTAGAFQKILATFLRKRLV